MLYPESSERCYTASAFMHVSDSMSGRKKPSGKEYGYTVVYQRMADGGFNVLVPAIPEICTFGETLPEARRMAKDAIRCYLESALETGEAIPKDLEAATERVAVTLP